MKRKGNLFESVCTLENLQLAYAKAKKGKSNTYGVRLFAKDLENNINQLYAELLAGTYKTSEYSIFTIYDPKEGLTVDSLERQATLQVMNRLQGTR